MNEIHTYIKTNRTQERRADRGTNRKDHITRTKETPEGRKD